MVRDEAPSSYYDNAFTTSEWFVSGAASKAYSEIYKKAILDISTLKSNVRIFEIGCGMGLFPDHLGKGKYSYSGIDFSPVAIEMCLKKGYNVKLHDIRDGVPVIDYDVVVAFETLEHIKDDLKVLAEIKKSTFICLSVPEMDDPSHIRVFKSTKEVIDRYKHNINIQECVKINRWFYLRGKIK